MVSLGQIGTRLRVQVWKYQSLFLNCLRELTVNWTEGKSPSLENNSFARKECAKQLQ